MSTVRPMRSDLADLVAVRRCDRIFDALAARRDVVGDVAGDVTGDVTGDAARDAAGDAVGDAAGDGTRDAARGDPAVRLLAALAADVDADPPATDVAEVLGSRAGPLASRIRPVELAPPARQPGGVLRSARAALTAGVAAAVLVTSGVAAARIGHFEPVQRVLGAQQNPVTAPSISALAAAKVHAALALARDHLDEGDYPATRQTLRTAWRYWAGVRGEEAMALAQAIEDVEERLLRESSAARTSGGDGDASEESEGGNTLRLGSPGAVRPDTPAAGPVKAGDPAEGESSAPRSPEPLQRSADETSGGAGDTSGTEDLSGTGGVNGTGDSDQAGDGTGLTDSGGLADTTGTVDDSPETDSLTAGTVEGAPPGSGEDRAVLSR